MSHARRHTWSTTPVTSESPVRGGGATVTECLLPDLGWCTISPKREETTLAVAFKVTQAGAPPAAAAAAPAAAAPVAAPTDIPLPTWTDYSSVLTYLTSIVAIGVGLFAAFQPGFHEPAAVQAVVPAVAFVVATGAQIYNAISHRNAHTQAAVAAINQGGKITPA